MSDLRPSPDPQVLELHDLIRSGSLPELRIAVAQSLLLDAPGYGGETAVIVSISTHETEKVKLIVECGADLEIADDSNSTPLLHAVREDFYAAVELLLSRNVDRGYRPKYPLKKIQFPEELFRQHLSENLKSIFAEEEWQTRVEEMREQLRETFDNPTVRPVIKDVQSVETLKLLIRNGDNPSLAPMELLRKWIGLPVESEFLSSKTDYLLHKHPSYGKSNPELMDFAFWRDMVRNGGHAHSARTHFCDEGPFSAPGAVWCFDRLGSAIVPLPDGRFIQVGGEHEDFYDPDFFIYNDVVVHDGKGDFQIYGYPKELFPPTDFHSATLCEDGIYLIGGLGYEEQQQLGFTPVYRLSIDSWKIEEIETFGDMPGWIHRHQSSLDIARNTITVTGGEVLVDAGDGTTHLISNVHQCELNLADRRWRRLQ